jgi:hypothetical protein
LSSTEYKGKFWPGYIIKYYRLLADVRSPFHHKLITFLFFVVVSTCFWFVRSLGEQYETNVTYPVRYTDFPENKVLIGDIPQKLVLRVRASGFSILKCRLNLNIIPLRFNVNSYAMNNSGKDTYVVITGNIRDMLSEELDQVKILSISPDTLFFRLSDIVTRKVPVMPALKIHDRFYQEQYTQNGDIQVLPDSITISGPDNIVNATHTIYTEPISFSNLADTVTTDSKLKPVKSLTYSVQKVKITIPVDRFTEVESTLPVQSVNVPDSLSMIAIPGQVKVTYHICLSNYPQMLHNPLLPRINYKDINLSHSGRLTVFLADTPGIISNVRFNPHAIEFLITRKK